MFEGSELKNLITWNEFYTIRPASKGITLTESALGVRLEAQALYEVMLLRSKGEELSASHQLGFYLNQNDFESAVFQQLYD